MRQSKKVYLVGAGPGDPELLTVKALRLIQSADVVVYDRLVTPEILELIPSGITRLYVGKAPGKHSMPQQEINELLASLAQNNHRVVRLKGGDPFVFGRGSEEALHLIKHGVQFEVVPGITAASACTAYAGIPLTHRGLSRGVHFITGHCRSDVELDIPWDKLTDPEETLVIYMGLASLDQIIEKLISAGLQASTPAAAIENGTTNKQHRVVATLQTLSEEINHQQLKSPVMIVIGQVVTLAGSLDWFEPAILANLEQQELTEKEHSVHV